MYSASFDLAKKIAKEIRRLAIGFDPSRCEDPRAVRAAARGAVRPIDCMRWAEFEAICRMLVLEPDQSVLDVASPQWFSLHLAASHPSVRFVYINYLESEIGPFEVIAHTLGLHNLLLKRT